MTTCYVDERGRLEEVARRIDRKIAEITDTVNSALNRLPDVLRYLAQRAIELWDHMWDAIRRASAAMAAPLRNLGNPFEILDTKDHWLSLVGPLSARAYHASPSGSRAAFSSDWKGDARNAYMRKLTDQGVAFRALQEDFIAKIADHLRECAHELIGLYGNLFLWWKAFEVALALGIVQCAGGAVPTGILTIAAGAVAAAERTSDAVSNAAGSAGKWSDSMMMMANDFAAFGQAGWPQVAPAR